MTTTTDTLVYSSTTGDTASDVDVVRVEHNRPRSLRISDPRYGIATAAKKAYDERTREQRAEFKAAMQAALTRQRDGIQTRLDGLQAEIKKVFAELETGKITGEARIDEAFGRLSRMGGTEKKLVGDIARLTAKIGA